MLLHRRRDRSDRRREPAVNLAIADFADPAFCGLRSGPDPCMQSPFPSPSRPGMTASAGAGNTGRRPDPQPVEGGLGLWRALSHSFPSGKILLFLE